MFCHFTVKLCKGDKNGKLTQNCGRFQESVVPTCRFAHSLLNSCCNSWRIMKDHFVHYLCKLLNSVFLFSAILSLHSSFPKRFNIFWQLVAYLECGLNVGWIEFWFVTVRGTPYCNWTLTFLLFFHGSTSSHCWAFGLHSDTSHSVVLLWTSIRPFAETSTWQRTPHTQETETSMRQVGFEPAIL